MSLCPKLEILNLATEVVKSGPESTDSPAWRLAREYYLYFVKNGNCPSWVFYTFNKNTYDRKLIDLRKHVKKYHESDMCILSDRCLIR